MLAGRRGGCLPKKPSHARPHDRLAPLRRGSPVRAPLVFARMGAQGQDGYHAGVWGFGGYSPHKNAFGFALSKNRVRVSRADALDCSSLRFGELHVSQGGAVLRTALQQCVRVWAWCERSGEGLERRSERERGCFGSVRRPKEGAHCKSASRTGESGARKTEHTMPAAWGLGVSPKVGFI